jgi:hypothetical protein
MPEPATALSALVLELRAEESVIADHVRDPDPHAEPALGHLVAAGPRAAADPGEYALLFEAIREGFLLHYARPRLLAGTDPDLDLLAGDYLYALGLRRLAALGDLEAVRELADLISLCAQVQGEPERTPERVGTESSALWLASAVAVGTGGTQRHEEAKAALRDGAPDAAARLWAAAHERAVGTRLDEQLRLAADAIDFGPDRSP